MLDVEAEETASALGRICALRDVDEYLLTAIDLSGARGAVDGQYLTHLTRELAQREAWRRGQEGALLRRVKRWQSSVSEGRDAEGCSPTASQAMRDMEDEDVLQANGLHKGDLCDGPFATLSCSRMLYTSAAPKAMDCLSNTVSTIHRRFFSSSHGVQHASAPALLSASATSVSSPRAAAHVENDKEEESVMSADVSSTSMLQWRRRWRVFFFLWSKLVEQVRRAAAARTNMDGASAEELGTMNSVVKEMPYTTATHLLQTQRCSFDRVWQQVTISALHV